LAGRKVLRRTDNSGLLSVLGRQWLKPIQSTSLLAIVVSPHEKNSDSREEDLSLTTIYRGPNRPLL
jgi:hypothetical protein